MDQKPDNISCLPEEIVQDIIDYLPLEDAVRTSVLSRLWKGRWVSSSVTLNSEADLLSASRNQEVTRVIAAFLASGDRSLKLCQSVDNENILDGVILLANKVNGTGEIQLNFLNSDLSTALEVFKLGLAMNDSPSMPHMTPKCLANLKILKLHSITVFSKDIVQEFFRSCYCLQSLSLKKCNGLMSLDIEANDYFKNIEILDCPDITNILISAKYVESFCYQGFMPPSIQILNAKFLVNVVLDFRKGLRKHPMFDCEAVLSLLEDVKSVKSLTISGWLIQELRCICRSIDEQKMNSVDCFSKIAPVLLSFSMEIDPSYDPVACPAFHRFWHEAHA